MTMADLTNRESQIVGCLVEGMTDKEIAASLHLSVLTVRKYMEALRQKVGAKNRVQVAVMAVRSELEAK